MATQRKVRFTLDEEDACDVLANLTPSDLVGRRVSDRTVVISFHEEEDSDEDE